MLFIANWKAYIEDLPRARALAALARRLGRRLDEPIVLAPPAPLLGHLAARMDDGLVFAAQDVSRTTGGATTGEATAQAYAAAGATYAIVGHSERRAVGDTDAVVAQKLLHASAHGLIPVLCVGEAARDTDGRYLSGVREQLARAFEGLSQKERAGIVVAYEPIWAIGKSATDAIDPTDLAEMALYIRKVLAGLLPGRSARRTKLLYGGSVEPANARTLAATGIDGFLVGHASVDPSAFAALIGAIATP